MPATHKRVPIPPVSRPAVPNPRKRSSSAITFTANDETIPPPNRCQTVDTRSPILAAPPQVTQDWNNDDDLDSLADVKPPNIIPAVPSK